MPGYSGHSLPEENETKFKTEGANVIIATPGRLEKCLGKCRRRMKLNLKQKELTL